MTIQIRRTFTATTLALAVLAPALSQAAGLDLSRYQKTGAYALPLYEASGITYNWDTDTLFVVGDEGMTAEVTKTGGKAYEGIYESSWSFSLAGSGSFNSFKDTEGLAYIGNRQFALVDERTSSLSLIKPEFVSRSEGNPNNGAPARISYTYTGKSNSGTYIFGPQTSNVGIEGAAYERSTGTFFAVKEFDPQGVYQADIQFGSNTATTTGSQFELFDPALLGLATLSDIALLSNSDAFVGASFADNLLIVSAVSQRLLEVTRSGQIVSSLDLSGYGLGTIEGVTVDNDGVIYLAAEMLTPGNNSVGSGMLVLAAPVPEPETYAMLLAGLAAVGAFVRRHRKL